MASSWKPPALTSTATSLGPSVRATATLIAVKADAWAIGPPGLRADHGFLHKAHPQLAAGLEHPSW